MFFSLYCKEIVAILTKLRFGLIEDESILEATVEGEGIKVHFLLLHYSQDVIRSGPVEVEFHVAVLVEGNDFEGLIREMFECVKFHLIFCQITISKHSSLQFDNVVLALGQSSSQSIGTCLPSPNCNVVVLQRLSNFQNDLSIKGFLHMLILIRVL